jgi:hypothetical protein
MIATQIEGGAGKLRSLHECITIAMCPNTQEYCVKVVGNPAIPRISRAG